MARSFESTQSEYLARDEAVLTATPITMACWFYPTDESSSWQTLMSLVDSGGDVDYFTLEVRPTYTPKEIWANTRHSSYGIAKSNGDYTMNAWHHACGIWAASNERYAFIDGGSKGSNTTSIIPAGINKTGIGVNVRATVGGYFDGRIAEAAIWNIALTDAEVAILAKGYSPLFVRPENLVAYWPLIRDEDADKVGNYNMTAYNTPGVTAHCKVVYPALPIVFMGTAGITALVLRAIEKY